MPTAASSDTASLRPQLLDLLLHEHQNQTLPRLDRLWQYYRNPAINEHSASAANRYQLAQEQGLPARLTRPPAASNDQPSRERVIENDIAWRIHTLVDFMFGRPVTIQSLAPDHTRRDTLEQFLRSVFENNGGVSFFQDLALLGSVYGFVDVLVRVNPATKQITLEPVEATRAIPVLDPQDYRQFQAYALHVRQRTNDVEPDPLLKRIRQRVLGSASAGRRSIVEHTQVWTPQLHQTYISKRTTTGSARTLASSEINRLGRIPVVHIQNLPQPYCFEGLSEVEPLIPLQNELNTRLSDRANRVTFQSFKMYLGKGIEQFTDRSVGPGQMWSTDNPDASIQEFGGDAHNPSEEAHINEVRDALDKTSGVTPVAAGLVRGKVGNLSSENAIRIVMMGLLAKTEKKRVTYGAGIARICELVLHAADVHGLLPNAPDERKVRLDWPSPIPDSENQTLKNAAMKLKLGVPRKQILAELGYSEV